MQSKSEKMKELEKRAMISFPKINPRIMFKNKFISINTPSGEMQTITNPCYIHPTEKEILMYDKELIEFTYEYLAKKYPDKNYHEIYAEDNAGEYVRILRDLGRVIEDV